MTAGMLIVGAGECGARAALALRERGYDGPVTLVGDEPHLPYERPPLSKDAMVSEAEPTPKLVGDREHFAEPPHRLRDRRERRRDRPRGAARDVRRWQDPAL